MASHEGRDESAWPERGPTVDVVDELIGANAEDCLVMGIEVGEYAVQRRRVIGR